MTASFATTEPARAEIDASKGPLLLEFGSATCGYCLAAQPLLAAALAKHATLPHIRIEDGRGRPLGRSFRIKLWPTLVFLSDGKELTRLVRPASVLAITEALAMIASAG
jgi:thioredoxin 1